MMPDGDAFAQDDVRIATLTSLFVVHLASSEKSIVEERRTQSPCLF